MRAGSVAFALAILSGGPSAAQRAVLTVDLGKDTFFEDEPVYVVLELKNLESDTLWIEPFGLSYQHLTLHLTRNGVPVPEFGLIADYVRGVNWRGEPVAPGQALYETCVLQDGWGTSDATSRDVFISHLAGGSYELTAQFVSAIPSAPGERFRTNTEVLRFDIRSRTPAEDTSFREFEQVRRMAWNLAQRPRYLSHALALIEDRLASNNADPYLAFLLRNGLATAHAIGQWPNDSTSKRIAQLRMTVAEAQKSLPAGAVTAEALYWDTPELASGLADLLQGSVAGRLAAERAERARLERRQPPSNED